MPAVSEYVTKCSNTYCSKLRALKGFSDRVLREGVPEELKLQLSSEKCERINHAKTENKSGPKREASGLKALRQGTLLQF